MTLRDYVKKARHTCEGNGSTRRVGGPKSKPHGSAHAGSRLGSGVGFYMPV